MKEPPLRYDNGPADWGRIAREGEKVTAQNRGNTRAITPDRNIIGLAGEYAFAMAARAALGQDVRMQIEVPLHGDGGVDFEITGVTIDVKTSGRPTELRYETKAGFPRAELYVLAGYSRETLRASLVGWTTGVDLAARDTTGSGFDGMPLLVVPAEELTPIPALWAWLARRKGHADYRRLGPAAFADLYEHDWPDLPPPGLDRPIMFDGAGERTTKTPVARKVTIRDEADLAAIKEWLK